MHCGWGVKAGMVCVWVAGKTVTYGPYLSALDMQHDKELYKFTLLDFILL